MTQKNLLAAIASMCEKKPLGYFLDGCHVAVKLDQTNSCKANLYIDDQSVFGINTEEGVSEFQFDGFSDDRFTIHAKLLTVNVLNLMFDFTKVGAKAEIRNFCVYVSGNDIYCGKLYPVKFNITDLSEFVHAEIEISKNSNQLSIDKKILFNPPRLKM